MANLTEEINGIEWIKYDSKAYKWNLTKRPVIKRFGKDWARNFAYANLPIPSFNEDIKKPTIAFYYEKEILKKENFGIFGFCDQQFQLESKMLGYWNNSIGIRHKRGIWVEECCTEFKTGIEWFNEEDVVGLGIVHHPNSKMECFATCNGKLLGKAELPAKFVNVKLFPALDLLDYENSVLANFGKEEWKFKEFKHVLE